MKRLFLYVLLTLSAIGGFSSCSEAQLINNNVLLDHGVAYIVSIDDATPQSVAYNTAFGSLTLPSTRTAHLSDGNTVELAITWSSVGYSATSPGIQTVYGDPTVPSPIINSFLARAAAQVDVQEQIITTTITAPTGFATWEIPAGVDTITYARIIGGGGTGGSVWNVASASGGGGGAYSESVDFPVTAGELAVLYIAPQQLGPLPTSTDLDGLDGLNSQFGPTAPAGSTVLNGSGAPAGGTGSDGNYYYDFLNSNFYGPKTAGAWGSPVGTPYVKAAGGKKGIISGAGGLGGATVDGIGDTKRAGGNGSTNATSRSGGGGGAGNPTSAGGNATIVSGTSVTGGTSVSPGGVGANGSSGAALSGQVHGGAGGGARNTVGSTARRGGAGEQGWFQIQYSGASTPPPDPGNAYDVAVWGQSNILSPGNGSPGAPYTGALESQMWINTSTGFAPLEYGVNNNPGGSLTGLGPELSIANAIDALAVDETYIIKKGQSGTSMYNNWNVANNSTGRSAVAQLVAAINYQLGQGKTIKEVYVVFRQGEADIPSTNPNGPVAANVEAEYKDKLQDLISYTIDHLEDDTGIDLTVVEFHWITVVVDNTTTADNTFQPEIISAQTDGTLDFDTDRPAYATRTAGLHTVSTSGLGTMDGIHFSTAAEITIGASAAAFMTITP